MIGTETHLTGRGGLRGFMLAGRTTPAVATRPVSP